MAQEQKKLREGLEAELAAALMQAETSFRKSISKDVEILRQTIANTEELASSSKKSGADPKQILEFYVSAFQSMKEKLKTMTQALEELENIDDQESEALDPKRKESQPVAKVSKASNAAANAMQAPNNKARDKAPYLPSNSLPAGVGSLAKPSEKALERGKKRAAEALLTNKAEDLYTRIRHHKDFDFFKEFDDVLETAGVATLKSPEAQDIVSSLKKQRKAIKKEINEACKYFVEAGGPLRVARTVDKSIKSQLLDLVGKTRFPAGYWDADFDVKKIPTQRPKKAAKK